MQWKTISNITGYKKMTINQIKYTTLYLIISLPLFLTGLFIFIMNIDNNINFSFIVFMITGLNLIISLYLPFILTITDLIKKG